MIRQENFKSTIERCIIEKINKALEKYRYTKLNVRGSEEVKNKK